MVIPLPFIEELLSRSSRVVVITCSYRQDAAKFGKLPVLNLLRGQKSGVFFAPQGRLVASIHVKFGMANGHVGLLGCAKFHLNQCRGWECAPKISKISTSLAKSHLAGANLLTDFLNFLWSWSFIRITILH